MRCRSVGCGTKGQTPSRTQFGYVKFFSKAKARTSEQARKAAMTRWQNFKRKKKYGRNKLVPLTKSKFAIVDARDFEQLKKRLSALAASQE